MIFFPCLSSEYTLRLDPVPQDNQSVFPDFMVIRHKKILGLLLYYPGTISYGYHPHVILHTEDELREISMILGDFKKITMHFSSGEYQKKKK